MTQWITLAQGKSLDNLTPGPGAPDKLPHGTPFRVEMDLHPWLPIAPVFDMIGSEVFAQRFLTETGGKLKDVEGVGSRKVILHCESNAVPILALIIGLALLFGAVGFMITAVKITTPAIEKLASGVNNIGLALIVGIVVALIVQVKSLARA